MSVEEIAESESGSGRVQSRSYRSVERTSTLANRASVVFDHRKELTTSRIAPCSSAYMRDIDHNDWSQGANNLWYLVTFDDQEASANITLALP